MNKMQTVDVLRTQGIMARGYGIIPQLIARDERLSPEAKSIYCYFSSFAGAGFEPVFPSRDLMLRELNMSKDRYYRHLKILIECNYISVERVKVGNLYSKNIYTLVQLPNAAEPVLEGTEAIHVKRHSSIKKRLGQDSKATEPAPALEPVSAKETMLDKESIQAKEQAPAIKSAPDIKPVENKPGKYLSYPENSNGTAGNLLRARLGIDSLIEKRPEHTELIQSIFMVIEDMWISEQVTMGGSVKKKTAIRKLIGSLSLVHIETIVNNIAGSGQKIRNKKAYILSCLSSITVDVAGPLDYSKATNKPDSESQEDIEKEKQRLEYQRNPELIKLDRQISEIGIQISKSILSGDELKTAALRRESELLEEKRESLIVRTNAISG